MPRTTKKAALALRQDPAAPFLFDEADLPTCPGVLESVRTGRYAHTGARLLDDDVKAGRLVELLCTGAGVARASEVLHVSRHTVRAAKAALVASGKLAHFKERFVGTVEEIIEVGASNYLAALEANTVPAGSIPIGVGIFFDKRQIALGEPTSIGVLAGVKLDRDSLSERTLNGWLESLSTGKDCSHN